MLDIMIFQSHTTLVTLMSQFTLVSFNQLFNNTMFSNQSFNNTMFNNQWFNNSFNQSVSKPLVCKLHSQLVSGDQVLTLLASMAQVSTPVSLVDHSESVSLVWPVLDDSVVPSQAQLSVANALVSAVQLSKVSKVLLHSLVFNLVCSVVQVALVVSVESFQVLTESVVQLPKCKVAPLLLVAVVVSVVAHSKFQKSSPKYESEFPLSWI